MLTCSGAALVCRCLALGAPMSLQFLFGYGSNIISLIFVGLLGREKMAAAVLGTSFSNVSGFALLTGLSSAMETFCGQVTSRLRACAACNALVAAH